MTPKLYMAEGSAVVRSVLLAEAALGITLDHVEVNVLKGEQLNPEFLKINPLHTLPTLVDEGKVITDSAAINIYLVEKYGKGSSLYPKDPYEKALVHQILHYASGDLFPSCRQIIKPIMLKGVKTICPKHVEELIASLEGLEKLLQGHVWAAGDKLTVADFALIPIISGADVVTPIDEKKFPNIIGWFNRVKQLPYYHCNEKGDEEFKAVLREKLNSSK